MAPSIVLGNVVARELLPQYGLEEGNSLSEVCCSVVLLAGHIPEPQAVSICAGSRCLLAVVAGWVLTVALPHDTMH
jgi:hypothetical protein